MSRLINCLMITLSIVLIINQSSSYRDDQPNFRNYVQDYPVNAQQQCKPLNSFELQSLYDRMNQFEKSIDFFYKLGLRLDAVESKISDLTLSVENLNKLYPEIRHLGRLNESTSREMVDHKLLLNFLKSKFQDLDAVDKENRHFYDTVDSHNKKISELFDKLDSIENTKKIEKKELDGLLSENKNLSNELNSVFVRNKELVDQNTQIKLKIDEMQVSQEKSDNFIKDLLNKHSLLKEEFISFAADFQKNREEMILYTDERFQSVSVLIEDNNKKTSDEKNKLTLLEEQLTKINQMIQNAQKKKSNEVSHIDKLRGDFFHMAKKLEEIDNFIKNLDKNATR